MRELNISNIMMYNILAESYRSLHRMKERSDDCNKMGFRASENIFHLCRKNDPTGNR